MLVIVPTFAATLYTTYEDRQREFAEAGGNANRIAKIIAIEEERLFDETRHILISLSHVAQTQDPRSTSCRKFFSHLLTHYKRYLNFGVIDTSGNVVCSAIPLPDPVNLFDRDYYQEAIKTRNFAIGKFQVGRISRRPTVVCAYPVNDGKDRVQGVVFAALDLNTLSMFERETGAYLPKGSSMSKIDASGTVLAQYPSGEGMTGKPFPKMRLIEPLMKRGSGLAVEKGGDGRKHLLAVASVPRVTQGREIFVVVSIPEEVAFFAINQTIKRNMTILTIIVVLMIGTAWFGSGFFILRPVHMLLTATDRVALGDLNGRAGPPYPKGELGELAQNFDRMTNALAERQAERERSEALLRHSEEKYRSI
ncbi:MAG: HAMP domain-containing protein, partial [Deltaproteobacteria bacterium]|nr:HAMP domain-containing protein [Deltaproteobacteria bacterium]